MRGKDVELFALFVHHGITPACAGKSKVWNEWFRDEKDHPRVCGEKSLLLGSSGSMGGSPPHMRGKVEGTLQALSNMRITPAYAGKRHNRSYQQGLERGSPPHVRGKVHKEVGDELRFGITPACAGKRSGPSPAAVPVGPAGSCPASRPSQFPPRMTVIRPRP